MNYYCENCYLLLAEGSCRFCGKKNLRQPKGEDFCFLIEKEYMFGEMFKGILAEEGIPCASFPSGNGMRSNFALKLENLKLFVPFEFFERAKELLNELFENARKEIQSQLIENLDRLFITPRNEKKFRKIQKKHNITDLISFCAGQIKTADSIDNRGRITDCIKGGEYIFITGANTQIIVNSVTYEIISVDKR